LAWTPFRGGGFFTVNVRLPLHKSLRVNLARSMYDEEGTHCPPHLNTVGCIEALNEKDADEFYIAAA